MTPSMRIWGVTVFIHSEQSSRGIPKISDYCIELYQIGPFMQLAGYFIVYGDTCFIAFFSHFLYTCVCQMLYMGASYERMYVFLCRLYIFYSVSKQGYDIVTVVCFIRSSRIVRLLLDAVWKYNTVVFIHAFDFRSLESLCFLIL